MLQSSPAYPTRLDRDSSGDEPRASRCECSWLYGHKRKFVTHGAGYHDRPGFPNPDIQCGAAEVYVLAWNVKAKGSYKNLSNHKVNAKSIVLLFIPR